MAPTASRKRMSYAEYLAAEAVAAEKHELVDGEAYSLAGGSRAHGLVTVGTIVALGRLLAGRACRVGSPDNRIYIPAWDDVVYPDVHVVCGRSLYAEVDPDAVVNPVLVVEVLSPTTERWDRGGKFQRYESLPSLQEYLLLDQEPSRAELYRRNSDGTFTRIVYTGEQEVELRSVGVRLPLSEVYASLRAERADG